MIAHIHPKDPLWFARRYVAQDYLCLVGRCFRTPGGEVAHMVDDWTIAGADNTNWDKMLRFVAALMPQAHHFERPQRFTHSNPKYPVFFYWVGSCGSGPLYRVETQEAPSAYTWQLVINAYCAAEKLEWKKHWPPKALTVPTLEL